MKPISITTTPGQIVAAVNGVYGKAQLMQRRAVSWDYCFSYFQEIRSTNASGNQALANVANISASCQRLYNFLGSWGMLVRGNALSRTNFVVLKPVIEILANPAHAPVWGLDVNGYFLLDPATGKWVLSPAAKTLLELIKPKGLIENALNNEFAAIGANKRVTDTLVTKIMLATTGSIMGYDSTVKRKAGGLQRSESGLRKVFDYHTQIAPTVAGLQRPAQACPLDPPTTRVYSYTQAKVLDMLFSS